MPPDTITLARALVERAYLQMIHAASAFKAAKPVRDELRAALALPQTSSSVVPAELIQELEGIAVGRTAHVFNGSCPDQVEGEIVRDDECPACQVLLRIDAHKRTV
jgi:hypothetical protein